MPRNCYNFPFAFPEMIRYDSSIESRKDQEMQNIIALIAADLAETGEMIRMTCTTDGDSFRAQLEDDTGCVLFDSQGDKALAAEGVSLATAIAKLDALCAMPYVGRLSAPAL